MQDEAIQWLLRQRAGDMSAEQWDEFTHWLEIDARHAEAFDALAAADDALDALPIVAATGATAGVQEPAAANDNGLARIIPWAMAAAAALVLAFFVFNPSAAPEYETFATAPGERRVVSLSDEIVMTLNGASEVTVEQGTVNVAIARGEVAFAIDAEVPSPLRVAVDDLVLTDYGTVFNVVLDEERFSVAVAEGVVAVNPDGEDIRIEAGEIAERARGAVELTRRDVAPETIATWRVGRLEFDNTLASEAVAQLERSAGVAVELADRFAAQRLTGSILIPEDDAAAVEALAAFIGGTVTKTDEGWAIE